MRIISTRVLGKALVCGVLWAAGALANPIFVSNFSFEDLPVGGLPNGCGAGCSYSVDAIPGWVNTGTSGQFQPGTPANTLYFNTLSDGITNAYSNGGTITQTVAPVVQVGVTYTLLVDVGFRNDLPMAGAAFLLVNGVLHGGTFAGPTSPGAFFTETIVYTGTAGDVGQAITIDLVSTGPQGNFDNVRLSDSNGAGVPEPAYTGVLAAVLAGLAAFNRRKRALTTRSN